MNSREALLWLLSVAGLMLVVSAHGPGPGPGIFPRRRSSNDGVMQSRAVDTRVQFEVPEGESRGTVVGYIPTKPGFTYRFNEPPREFTLDTNTGEIKLENIRYVPTLRKNLASVGCIADSGHTILLTKSHY